MRINLTHWQQESSERRSIRYIQTNRKKSTLKYDNPHRFNYTCLFMYRHAYRQYILIILCVHIETSSLWAEFVNKNRCISVRFYSRRLKAFNFDDFDNSHNSFLWPEYFIDFLCERWIPCQAVTPVLCFHYRPETVHCSTKDAYTSEVTFLSLHYNLVYM